MTKESISHDHQFIRSTSREDYIDDYSRTKLLGQILSYIKLGLETVIHISLMSMAEHMHLVPKGIE